MPLLVVGVSHHAASSDELSLLGACCTQVRTGLSTEDVVSGSLVLATCNRFEVYVDATRFHDAVDAVTALVSRCVGAHIGDQMEVRVGDDAVRHAMAVCAGLDSMVVGEAEIAGQVRAAMAGADLTPRLRRLFQHSLTTSKAVASGTALGEAGRSLASVALDLVEARHGPLAGRQVLLIGTGSYARIVVGDLVRRAVSSVVVHSPSGRAARFAQTHDVAALDGGQLPQALAAAHLVISCSGGAAPVLERGDLELRDGATCLPIVDLSPARDVADDVRTLPGVDLLDLDEIGRHVPQAASDALSKAWAIVNRGVAAFGHMECGRAADPAVVAMRTHIARIIEAELENVSRRYPTDVAEAVARSLRRVSNALLHTPSIRAHELARTGELDDYRKAMSTLFGIDVDLTVDGFQAEDPNGSVRLAPDEAEPRPTLALPSAGHPLELAVRPAGSGSW
jgi:glutamyl-tRNA reductase